MRTVRVPTRDDVRRARAVVARHLTPTPVVPATPGVVFKLETLQPTGSFKVRGALVAVSAALERHPDSTIVTASAGNHGLGVAWAATRLGASATIVVPETAAPAKLAALAHLDVAVVRHGSSYDEAEAHALAMAQDATYVSPYNDPDVIAGQATIATELRTQVADLACVVVPVGGGGLAAGVGLALSGTGVSVVGAGVERSPAMAVAVREGDIHAVVVGSTMADGLAGNLERGSVTVGLVRAHVQRVVSVDEEALVVAMACLATGHGLVVEASGAAGLAAITAGLVPPVDGTTAVVLSGRNIDAAALAGVLGAPRR